MRVEKPESVSNKMWIEKVMPGDVFLWNNGLYYQKTQGSPTFNAVKLLDGQLCNLELSEMVEVVDCFLKIERR